MKEFFARGSTVLFQGDSVTDSGRDYLQPEDLGEGYPDKVATIYRSLFPQCDVQFINRGVSGNRSKDLLQRFKADIRDVSPSFISILIGINDVWRRYDNDDVTSAQQYEENLGTLLKQIKKHLPQTKIMLMEPFVLHSLPDRVLWHEDLDEKLQCVRHLAEGYADYFVPLDGKFAGLIASRQNTASELSKDGVHPTQLGHAYIAMEYLRALSVL